MDIHEKILKLCKERGWSFFKLAKESCIPATTVYNWFNDNHFTPSRDKIEDLCEAFNISVAEFYADVDASKLSVQELKVLETYRKLTEKNKEKALTIMTLLIED